jgi:protein ImuB
MFACLFSSSASQTALLTLASSFSPLVENTAPGAVVFSIAGLGKLIGGPQEIAAVVARTGAEAGIQANLAISADPDAALLAARNIGGITFLTPGREIDSLGGLPIDVLETDPAILDTLHRWGIRTLGELAALPELGFVARFGEEGTRLQRLVRGEIHRSLRAVQAPEAYERRVEFEHRVVLLEPLLFVLSSKIRELTTALEHNGLAANRVTLRLTLEKRLLDPKPVRQRVLEFPVPVRDAAVILKQLQFDLEAHPPEAAIVAFEIKLHPAEPRTVQHGLFVPQAPPPEKLQLTLARLTALVGEGNAGSPELLDTHRRDAFVMRAFAPEQGTLREKTNPSLTCPLFTSGKDAVKKPAPSHFSKFAFRHYRPPIAAEVRVRAERPAFVNATSNPFQDRAIRGEVVSAAGPWRLSGDWWTTSGWNRDEWDVALSDGGVYRIYMRIKPRRTAYEEHRAREWFLEGVYD